MSFLRAPNTRTLNELEPIHLFRALLREASYLPDSLARKYFHEQLVSRFKAQQPVWKARKVPHWKENEKRPKFHRRRSEPVIQQRATQQLKAARKALSFLRRANGGDLSCLQKVLLFTYGRVGRRRYALQQQLLVPESLPNSDAVSALMESGRNRFPLQDLYYSDKRFLSFFDTPKIRSASEIEIKISSHFPKLYEVIETQRNAQPQDDRANIRRSMLIAPSKNVWQRPMPIKRARNIVRRWYKDTMAKLQPPLPEHEWDRLKGLSTGEIKWEGPVWRRSPGTLPDSSDGNRDVFQRTVIEAGLVPKLPPIVDKPRGKNMPHSLTPRFMRRIYTHVFTLSCKVTWDPAYRKWRCEFGYKKRWNNEKVVPLPKVFFAGVDQNGKIIQPPKPPKLPEASKPRETPSEDHALAAVLLAWRPKHQQNKSGSRSPAESRA